MKLDRLTRFLKLYPLLDEDENYVLRHIDERVYQRQDLRWVKKEVDKAIATLSYQQQKVIILSFVMQIPIGKIQSMLGFAHRVQIYKLRAAAFIKLEKLLNLEDMFRK